MSFVFEKYHIIASRYGANIVVANERRTRHGASRKIYISGCTKVGRHDGGGKRRFVVLIRQNSIIIRYTVYRVYIVIVVVVVCVLIVTECYGEFSKTIFNLTVRPDDNYVKRFS